MKGTSGFTLIELAVVIAIVGFLLGGLLLPLGTQMSIKHVRETERMLSDIKEALIGFAMVNGRLPCPDFPDPVTGKYDGVEDQRKPADPANWGCSDGVGGGPDIEGPLPWTTLGLGRVDAWGSRFRYRVSNEFTRRNGDASAVSPLCPMSGNDNPCTLELGDFGDITIRGRNTDPTSPDFKKLFPLVTIPAVVVSHGPNRFGATQIETSVAPPPLMNIDEVDNQDGNDGQFVSRTLHTVSNPCDDTDKDVLSFCEFDDIIVWVSGNLLMNRLVVVGKLP